MGGDGVYRCWLPHQLATKDKVRWDVTCEIGHVTCERDVGNQCV